jgi:hypothetical protein
VLPLAHNLNVQGVRLGFSLPCAVHIGLLTTFFNNLIGLFRLWFFGATVWTIVVGAKEWNEIRYTYNYLAGKQDLLNERNNRLKQMIEANQIISRQRDEEFKDKVRELGLKPHFFQQKSAAFENDYEITALRLAMEMPLIEPSPDWVVLMIAPPIATYVTGWVFVIIGRWVMRGFRSRH